MCCDHSILLILRVDPVRLYPWRGSQDWNNLGKIPHADQIRNTKTTKLKPGDSRPLSLVATTQMRDSEVRPRVKGIDMLKGASG